MSLRAGLMTRLLLLGGLLLLFSGSRAGNPAGAALPENEEIAEITGPTAIGIFPPTTQEERDNDDGGLSEGYAHLAFALQDVQECLKPRPVTLKVKITRSLLVVDGAATHQFAFPDDWGHAVAIVLSAPGRSPVVVYATAGPSSLQELAPQAAWQYFSEPNCKRFDESAPSNQSLHRSPDAPVTRLADATRAPAAGAGELRR